MRRDFGHEPQDKGYFSFPAEPVGKRSFFPAGIHVDPLLSGRNPAHVGPPAVPSELKTGSRPFL